jgi:hypothetical protein
LGYLFGVSEPTARRTGARLLPLLAAAGRDTMRLPDPGKGHRRDLDALLAATPDLAVLIDTFEQRVQRPRDRAEADTFEQRVQRPRDRAEADTFEQRVQRPRDRAEADTFEQRVQRPRDRAEADTYYSGKKRQHTLKSQLAVDERDGRIVDVAESVRGPTHDFTLLKGSGLLARLPPEVGALGDLAYVGIENAHPAALGATPRKKPRRRPRPPEDVAYNAAFARRRVLAEHTSRRVRGFEAVTQPDRHHRRGHTPRVRAVAGLVNRQLDDRHAA